MVLCREQVASGLAKTLYHFRLYQKDTTPTLPLPYLASLHSKAPPLSLAPANLLHLTRASARNALNSISAEEIRVSSYDNGPGSPHVQPRLTKSLATARIRSGTYQTTQQRRIPTVTNNISRFPNLTRCREPGFCSRCWHGARCMQSRNQVLVRMRLSAGAVEEKGEVRIHKVDGAL
jgi:hypothetical protein